MRNVRAAAIAILLVLACAACTTTGGTAGTSSPTPVTHPGAVNDLDWSAYIALGIAQDAIDGGKAYYALKPSPSLKTYINDAIKGYDAARAAWLAYRHTAQSGGAVDPTDLHNLLDALKLATGKVSASTTTGGAQ